MRMAWLWPLLAALMFHPCPAQSAELVPTPSSPVPADDGSALSLARALDMALAHHPGMAAARSEVAAAEAAGLQAGARPNPVIEAEVEDLRRDTRTTTILFSQPIELGGKRSARMALADRSREIAQGQLLARRRALSADVTAAFFDVLAAQERVPLAQAAHDLARRGTDAVSRRVSAGKSAPIEQTRAEVVQAGARIELLQAEGELRAALRMLTTILGTGLHIERVQGTALQLPALPGEEELEARLVAAPVLWQGRLEADRLGAQARLERAKGVPDLTLGVGTRRSAELGRNQPVVTLSLPLPFFDANLGAQREALRRQEQAQHETAAAALRLRADVTRAHERLRASRAEVEALQDEVLPRAQASHEAASKGFELGKFDFLDALDAQRTLIQARTQRLRAVAQAHRAAAEIDHLLGADVPVAPKAQP